MWSRDMAMVWGAATGCTHMAQGVAHGVVQGARGGGLVHGGGWHAAGRHGTGSSPRLWYREQSQGVAWVMRRGGMAWRLVCHVGVSRE